MGFVERMSVHRYPLFTILAFCVMSSKAPAQSNFYLVGLSNHKFLFQIPPPPLPRDSTVRLFVAFREKIGETTSFWSRHLAGSKLAMQQGGIKYFTSWEPILSAKNFARNSGSQTRQKIPKQR